MNRNKLISCFWDTLRISESILCTETLKAISSNQVYKENLVSKRDEHNSNATIIVEENTTFSAAKKYSDFGKVSVLNFANPVTPGGGVESGAMAQEECLCRSSNLYPCLKSENVWNSYYAYNKSIGNNFFSDRLIYTKDVTVFKTDDAVPQLMKRTDWFQVDVITCSAPYLGRRRYTNKTALKDLLKIRIKNIFESAIDNEVEVLILGAFGCGAFKNPSDVVAKAFREVIEENNYKKCFNKIVFAIKISLKEENENIASFIREFDKLRITLNCPEYELPQIKLPNGKIIPNATVGYTSMPSYTTMDEIKMLVANGDYIPSWKLKDNESDCRKQESFLRWQLSNKYYGKKFSILGDSISTLEGFNPSGYSVYYNQSNSVHTGIRDMEDTWWGKIINFFGGELLVNNSWSGSRVTKVSNSQGLFPSGLSEERTSGLHINNVKPDIIIVYLGFNDWANGVKISDCNILGEKSCDVTEFFFAYNSMIEKLKSNYPKAEIWCCTLNTTYMSSNLAFDFPSNYARYHIEVYNDSIRSIVRYKKCNLIDLYSYQIPYDSVDGSHPTSEGMNTLATIISRKIGGEDVDKFLDCENNRHKFKIAEEYTGGTKYVCKKCGKEKHETTLLLQNSKLYNYNEKVILPKKMMDYSENDVATTVDLSGEEDNEENSCATSENLCGKVIGNRYKITQHIAKGGFYNMYLVTDETDGKVWALKSCKKSGKSAVISTSIKQEAFLCSQLKHYAIPQIMEVIEDNEYIFIVREYIEGNSLDEIIKNCGTQSVDLVVEWAKQLCEVLHYLHTRRPTVIHRDVKPANIVLASDGQIKLIDFSIALSATPECSDFTWILGTKGYAPPEQYVGSKLDGRTDIYGLGMTLYYLLTGIDPSNPPYEVKPLRAINPALPKGLEYIISKCTETNRDNRYNDCWELLSDLNRYQKLSKRKGLLDKFFFRK